MVRARRPRTIIGVGKDFEMFRRARASFGQKVRTRTAQFPSPKPKVHLSIAPDAVRKVNLIKSLTLDEREVAQSILGFIDKSPGAFFEDIKTRAGGKWYRKEIMQTKSVVKKSPRSKEVKFIRGLAPVEAGTITRIYAILVKEGIVLGETRSPSKKV